MPAADGILVCGFLTFPDFKINTHSTPHVLHSRAIYQPILIFI